jgi:hypothetical protein
MDANGAAMDSAGNLYVADNFAGTVRRVSPSGTNWVVTTLAGSPLQSGSADGTNEAASFNRPEGLAADRAGNLYVADSLNYTIRKVSPSGRDWVVTTIAGSAQAPGNADGTNSDARFSDPQGMAADAAGNLYVADKDNGAIRKLTPSGTNWVVTTLGALYSPGGVTVDSARNLYVTDVYTVRKGTPVWPPTALSISAVPGKVVLSWPASASGFVLETTSNLTSGASWVPLTNGISTVNDRFVLTNNITASPAFYRLHVPGTH